MKTVLCAINAKYIHTNLAIRYIKGFSRSYGFEIFEATINDNVLKVALDILGLKPDIIGFSCYIWNIDFTLKACSIIKAARPEIIVVLGGPEADFDARAILSGNRYVDYVIRGEGEDSFRMLYESLEFKRHTLEKVPGLCYRQQNGINENQLCEAIDMNLLPFPYDSVDKNKIYYYEASRGCPFNCSYCLSSTNKGIRTKNINFVKAELMWFIENDIPLVKFVDRTFNANKKFALEIWSFLIKNVKKTCFHFEIAADIMDDEQIEVLSKAPKGLFQLEIGVQTTNQQVLGIINRVMDFNRVYSNVMKILDGGNIQCHMDLIAGLPGENLESFIKSFDMTMDIKPSVLQLGFLKVLKGSPMMDNVKEYGLRYMPCAPYEILQTDHLGLMDMRMLTRVEEVLEDFYNSSIIPITMSILLENSKSSFQMFRGLSEIAENEDYYKRRFDIRDKFMLIYKYCTQTIPSIDIRDVLAVDYILTTRKSYLPDFLKRELTVDGKNKIMAYKERIRGMEKSSDIRSIVFIPVNSKIIKNNNSYSIVKWTGLCCIDTARRSFEYI